MGQGLRTIIPRDAEGIAVNPSYDPIEGLGESVWEMNRLSFEAGVEVFLKEWRTSTEHFSNDRVCLVLRTNKDLNSFPTKKSKDELVHRMIVDRD